MKKLTLDDRLPWVICENTLPDRYYQVIHRLDANQSKVYVFIGQVPVAIREVLDLIQTGKTTNQAQLKRLEQHFGSDYRDILGLGHASTPTYLPDLIEIDDSVAAIKNKLAVSLHLSVDWEYLYAKIDVGGGQIDSVCLGHTLIERKQKE